ncbi:MAG TPA: chemotaxis protein CheC [Candidatus Polarisedimenticolia bacterium]|nr:chemotaxis protein CheC [Candidatus Polarisedimenticolia bacterium]
MSGAPAGRPRPRGGSPAGPLPDLRAFRAICEAGARNAATALSQMIGRPVRLEVPWARAIPLEKVAEIAGGATRVVCALSLKVYGEARGNLLLAFGEDQVPLLLKLVVRGGGERHGTPAGFSDLAKSALREVGNILAGAYLNAVSHLLGVSLLPSIPGLAIDMVGAVTDHLVIEMLPLSETAVVLASEVLEPASGLRGEFFFLPDPRTLPVLGRGLPGREADGTEGRGVRRRGSTRAGGR